jgi:hypothetical protein
MCKVERAAWKSNCYVRHEVESARWCRGDEREEEIVGIFESEDAVDPQILKFAGALGGVVEWGTQPDIKFQSLHNVKR